MLRAAFFVGALLAGLLFAMRRAAAAGAEGATVSYLDAAASWAGGLVGFDALYQKHAAARGVDWRLVKAIAQHESGELADAVNARDHESLGLMQVLCRPDGRGGCANRLNVEGWADATREKLLDPEFNVYIGVQILASNIDAYGVPKGIAVYNAWDQHTAPAEGPFRNQRYVDDVLRRARLLGWEG
jgi:soluble lytic murein transglycosylase-like protein